MSQTEAPSSPAANADTPASKPPPRQILSTGNRWTDFKLAVQRISLWDDLTHLGEVPCARKSLLSGIASGVGIGVIRGINVGPFVASNWAIGTFLVVSVGTWQVCRSAIHREREQLKVTMGHMNRRKVVRTDDDTRSED